MNKVLNWLTDAPIVLFTGVFWFLGCLWNVSFDALIKICKVQLSSQYNFEPPQSAYDYIVVILIAPLIETALFQALPYHLLRNVRFFERRTGLIVIISGLLFVSQHFYSVIYIVFAFVPGILLATGYHLRQGHHAFFSITAVHFSINAAPLLYELLFSGIN